jgi:phage terminase large subunit GpA-like protein
MRKEFSGGSLEMASAQSASSLRSDSKRILVRDEIDGAPKMLTTGEGNWIHVSFARTLAWGGRKKIFDLSTPTIFGESAIWEQYTSGDQCKYLVPCPFCKKLQELKFEPGGEKLSYGLKAIFKNGLLEDTYYECEHCHKAIQEKHKPEMLSAGKWTPTAKANNPDMHSVHLNALYSPIGMLSWKEFYKLYLDAQEDPDGMRWFTNLYLGLPFKEKGARPDLAKVIELRGHYHHGTVPHGVLYITAGIDVQAGNEGDENNPPRLEMEIVGHGAGFKTWQILYKIFPGKINDPFSGSWEALTEWAKETGLTFYRDDRKAFQVNLIFIDSGFEPDIVYRFTETWENTFPSKGFGKIQQRRGEKSDDAGPTMKRYRPAALGGGKTLYEISTNYYKTHVYNNLKIPRQDGQLQRPGFCEFPIEASEKYFQQLTAAEKRLDGSFYSGGRRDEALDCRVYALCAGDVYLDSLVLEYKGAAKMKNMKPQDILKINHRFVLDLLQKKYS